MTYATNQEKLSSTVFRSIMRSVKADAQIREILGDAIRPHPEWWLNGDPHVIGHVSMDSSIRVL
jgi:cytochrome c oxidase assembly factor 1